MATHYSQLKKYRDLSFLEIARVSEKEAWEILRRLRWGNDETTVCPDCETRDKHHFVCTRKQWTCKHCSHRFSVTSATPFSSHKISFLEILVIVYFFASASQGQSANLLHAQAGLSLKTIYLYFGKIREVLHETNNFKPLEGVVHIDCAHFCGKPRRANIRKKTDSFVVNNRLRSRKDSIVPDLSTHPEPRNQKKLQNRRILLTMSQCDTAEFNSRGSNRTICMVIKQEKASTIIPLIKKYVSPNALIMTDCGNAFSTINSELGNRHFTVNHSEEYMSKDGVSNNMAESFFSRIRRAEFGVYNGMRSQYFAYYAAEFSWRADSKHMSLKEKFEDILSKVLNREPSKAFTGYNDSEQRISNKKFLII